MIGKIDKILPSGYGFIVTENGDRYFFHISSYNHSWDELKTLTEYKEVVVQFEPTTTLKGLRAEKVEVIL